MSTDITGLLAEAEKAKKVNWDRLDTQIEHEGRAIKLPGDPGKMPIAKAIEALQRKQKDEEQMVAVHEVIDGHPFDGLVAFVKAMANLYGWSSPVPTPGFFGPRPPQMISVKTGHRDEDIVQCPHGAFVLPGVEKPVNTAMGNYGVRGQPALVIYGEVRKREKHLLVELANEARRILKAESIYRGKAIRFAVDNDGNVDMNSPPEYMDTSTVTEDSLLFNEAIKEQINTNILVPMKETARCRELKIPLKRGILLEGPYGTGKSLTAAMAAKVAEDNGWTFILLDKVQGLHAALEFANRYAPAVVFAEDIDRIATVRDEKANDLINTIDGVVSKRSEIMTILTTNFAENLNPVILRPGRLDAVISLRAPDAVTVAKLIRFYAGDLLDPKEALAKSALELDGQIPASIRECVERAKLGMIGRGDNKLSDTDILTAAQTMKNHLALLNKDKTEPSVAEVLASSLKKVVHNGTGDMIAVIDKRVEQIHDNVC
jgi:transitional endoplasmic reticulum ATPase